MSGSDAFQVHAGNLVTHAGEVNQIGDGLTTAAQAGQAVQTDTGAYGQLCQFVPALLNGLQQAMVDGMTTAAESVHDTAESRVPGRHGSEQSDHHNHCNAGASGGSAPGADMTSDPGPRFPRTGATRSLVEPNVRK